MNTETNISPAPVRRLGGLSNLSASAGAGGKWRLTMSADPGFSVEDVRKLVELERAMERGEQPHVVNRGGRWAFSGELLAAVGLRMGEVVSDATLYQLQVLNLRHLEELIAEQRVRELEAEP